MISPDLPALFLQAATPAPAPSYPGLLGQLSALEQLLLFCLVAIFLIGCWALLDLSFKLMALQRARILQQYSPEVLQEVGLEELLPKQALWQRLYEKLTDRVPVEQEAALVLDHEYDGIRELDNNLPPWWKGLFYASIAFAPLYIYFVHFSDYGLSSREAYAVEIEESAASVKAFLATQENAVDESNVVYLAEADALGKGGIIFMAKCAACHGKLGEGGIGPNLTDEFWLHGGDIKDVFRTIKHGVPEKGMIPWKNELRPRDMQEVASFIMSLVGTNPPNAKEAQGERYVAGEQTK